MNKLHLVDLPVKNKKVLVRVDFNVPLTDAGTISDDTRIVESLPTLRYILDHGGSVILMSHLGRPKGKKDPKFSLAPCAKRLEELLKRPVIFAPDCVGERVESLAKALRPGEVLMLENLRFHEAEEKPETDPLFAKKLARLGDCYVDDAFGAAHRAHSSITALAHLFPEAAAAGLLLQKEIAFLGQAFSHPQHPFYAIIGGAKVSSKLGVLQQLLSKVDGLFIGGAMAYTFLLAKGIPVGKSLVEKELVPQTLDLLKSAEQKKVAIHLPIDILTAKEIQEGAEVKLCSATQGIPEGWEGVDIGPKTILDWSKKISNAHMIFWNGPLGIFEIPTFAKGTQAIARFLAELKAMTIVGGGDSVAAINLLKLSKKFTHISTGGGASLEYIEHGHLPGIDALSNKKV